MAHVTFKGNPFSLDGSFPAVGDKAPPFTLVDANLQDVSLSSFAGKKKVLTINPSYDTPVCAKAAKEFQKRAGEKPNVVVVAISADLPFAQGRFCSAEGVEGLVTLSTFRHPEFAQDYGVAIAEGPLAKLTARAVVVIDDKDRITHAELVGEIADEPDYEKALSIL